MNLVKLEKFYIEAKLGVIKQEYFEQLKELKDVKLIGNESNFRVSSGILSLIKNR